jgi:membrane protease subunit HflK
VADEDEHLTIDERADRSAKQTLANVVLLFVLLVVLAGWASLGAFQLEPGQSAVLLQFGRYTETISEEGFHLTLPPPIVTRKIVNVSEVERQDFGFRGGDEGGTENRQKLLEASMQTSDNNIIRLSFVVQYRISDAFEARFRLEEPVAVLRDAAQAAVREVVGRMTIDGVLSEQRGELKLESARILQDILDSYGAGLEIQDVQLQEVQPPPEVRAAFDDVVAAAQDASRAINEAQGYRNEFIPGARAEAAELVAAAEGYREAKVAEATGEAERFVAIAAEHRKAPEVTEKRLYLETMEAVLPKVEKIIIEPGTASVLPYLPLGRSQPGRKP